MDGGFIRCGRHTQLFEMRTMCRRCLARLLATPRERKCGGELAAGAVVALTALIDSGAGCGLVATAAVLALKWPGLVSGLCCSPRESLSGWAPWLASAASRILSPDIIALEASKSFTALGSTDPAAV